MKTHAKLHRVRFRLRKTIKGIFAAFRNPEKPKRLLLIKKSGMSRYCMDDMREGVGEVIASTIQELFDEGQPGDKVTIILDEMNADEWDELEDWEGWSN